ncbi:hypothetical protein [Sphingomonas crocodyli]|uniref:Glycosyl hydrolase n=1 Tax=Sphingomonas crocodyli TaxID=1979270 RepID=A0A437LXL6_9SPHN|nr:hypothetical protein [Sphingomonas crocodyli]RVT90165.1 hypothetical protein EOD43_17825 [Sphingomonas crocodyli]
MSWVLPRIFAAIAATASTGVFAAGAMSVRQFTDSIGVNTHFNYSDGGYANWRQVIGAVRYLGIDHVRDAAPRPGGEGQQGLAEAAKSGLKFMFIVSGGAAPEDRVTNLMAFRARYPRSVAGIEGPNEVNNSPVTFAGIRDIKGKEYPATIAYMSALRRTLRGSPLADLPLLAPSSIGPTKIVEPSDVDAGNIHAYPQSDESLASKVAGMVERQSHMVGGGKPIYFTEMGYNDLRADPTKRTQQTLKWLTTNAAIGVRRSYIYELLDAYPDPSGKSYEKHWGLFDRQFVPKPVARALHNLIWILGDDRGAQRPIGSYVTAAPSGAEILQLNRSDGHIFVLLWQNSDAAVGSIPLKLNRPANYRFYNPRLDLGPLKTGKGDAIDVETGDDLVVIELWG